MTQTFKLILLFLVMVVVGIIAYFTLSKQSFYLYDYISIVFLISKYIDKG